MSSPREDRGFTLIELTVVVLIIGVLIAIAIPTFFAARSNAERRTCYVNERVMEGAYNEYVAAEPGAAPINNYDDLKALVIPSRVATEPKCPSGGQYSFVNKQVFCTIHGSYHDAQ